MLTLHVVGDSISMQYGPFLLRYLAGVVDYSRKEGMPGDPDDPNGANGGDSSLVLRYLTACREHGLHWDWLLLNCGLHDIKTDPLAGTRQVAEESYPQNLSSIIALARSLAGSVVWVRTTPVVDAIHNTRNRQFHRFAADVDRYNAMADRLMQQHGIASIDLFNFTRALGDEVYVDHVHFTENVQQLQAAYIAGYVMSLAAAPRQL